MTEEPGRALRRYHEETKHSPERLRSMPHYLDWENQPVPLKLYVDLPGETLPRRLDPGGVPALEAIAGAPVRPAVTLDRAAIGRLLHYSLGIVRRRELPDGRAHYFRAAPCTGALYHVDAYLVCADLPDLGAGVYHFGPHDFSLRRLRQGDFREALVEAAGGEGEGAPALLVLASTWWRNAWKYRSRAYRHVFWDGGAILSQLLAEASADGWRARVVTAFADPRVEEICGLDPKREGPLALIALGAGSPPAPKPHLAPVSFATEPLSADEVDYPSIPAAHRASALADADAVRRWRGKVALLSSTAPGGPALALPPSPAAPDPLERVILRRGSTRIFSRRPIAGSALGAMLRAASAPLAADYRPDPGASLVDLFVIVHAVDGVAAGTYRWRSAEGVLEPLRAGDFRAEAGGLALGQALAADAAVNVYAIADLDRILGALGDRGYRAAQLDGAIAGGRIYLAAYALRLGATGLTFFDDDVSRFFGLEPQRWGVMFLVAAGMGARI